METLVNARNLPEGGVRAIAALVRSVPAYELRYADLRVAWPRIAALVERAVTEGTSSS
jgi:hypothetical protein